MAIAQTYVIPQKLTIAQAQQEHARLHALLDCADSDCITIDCDQLDRIDASGAQVLLALEKDAKRLHKSVEWVNTNRTLTDSMKILGLESEFSFKSNAAGG